ncbi:protein of unknown function [Bosea sp. CRIB-10]|uniref:DUF4376 domain-containing protein n=1 Tax=Bosea sp. CRIB-10 TaxID=378404 RepID=UPI0008F0320E|nr:DUF4376 domain-containing protein [Bosea sp. CRIB-10]SFC21898.1 protein of unknown function [Bosea sp. CRIB-10]
MTIAKVDLAEERVIALFDDIPEPFRHVPAENLLDMGWAGMSGIGYFPAYQAPDPAFDPAAEVLAPADPIVDLAGKQVALIRAPRAMTIEEAAAYRSGLRAHAADVRWRKETGGITVAGVTVLTDRDSQAMINGAGALCDKVPATIVRFKAATGFVDLDAATMTAIAIAVGQHVQSVFATEAEVVAAIDAGTITTRAQVEVAFS